MKIELKRISEIKPFGNNPRINDRAVDTVARSITEFGWRVPIVCDEHLVILAGHTRYKAAIKLGIEDVPVHIASGLTPTQAKAFRIADNKSAELSTWDYELLPIELGQLKDMNYNLDLLGFDQAELAKLLQPIQVGLCDPDDVPAPPDEAITRRGDLWLLGKHRLLCGDSAKAADVDRLIDQRSIHLVNTDPPYGVRVEPRSNNAIASGPVLVRGHASSKARRRALPRRANPPRTSYGPGIVPWSATTYPRRISTNSLMRGSATWPVPAAGTHFCGMGWLRQPGQLPAVPEETWSVLQPGDRVGQGTSGAHAQGLYGGI